MCPHLPICVWGIKWAYASSAKFCPTIGNNKTWIGTKFQVAVFDDVEVTCNSILKIVWEVPEMQWGALAWQTNIARIAQNVLKDGSPIAPSRSHIFLEHLEGTEEFISRTIQISLVCQ